VFIALDFPVPRDPGKGDFVVVVVVVGDKSLTKLCYLIADSLSSYKRYLLQPF
jgi:hypothetical protein